ncbi:MAG: hypothetical protein CMG74_05655 [Candidatus Marinimicrobia bacterium]|nr:hypothetical protein [Candidatus Neomarinimicrobiota bacterium]|tara:strand:- start:6149 stop:9247 length:3099 start_codon:yes stop_codon:yes gene_type:complete
MKKIIRTLILFSSLSIAFSQTSGKISGTVKSEDGTLLVGANIFIKGTSQGASANDKGEYQIIGVTAGTYTVSAAFIGYSSVDVENVRVQSSLNTKVDFTLNLSAVEGEVVTVTAEAPLIQVDETSSVTNLSSEELRSTGVRDLNSILATVAGVVVQDDEIHIRGGRDNEVAYYLNGASVTNAGSRNNMVYTPIETVEEMQVQVGGYDAEVSGANSGVVKRRLKEGTDSFRGSFKFQNDGSGIGNLGDAPNEFLGATSFGHSNMLAQVSGPILGDMLKFYVAFEQKSEADPYVKASEKFNFSGLGDEYGANAAYADTFDIKWQDGFTPGSKNQNTNITSTLTFDSGPAKVNLGVVQNSSEWNSGGGIMSQLRWGGADITTMGGNSVSVDPRYMVNKFSSLMLTAEATYSLSESSIIRLAASTLNTDYHNEDSWFGEDWEKWGDSLHVQQKIGIADTVWTPFKDRYSQRSSYQHNGMWFSRPGTSPGSYWTSSNDKTGISGSFQTIMGDHDLKVGFDYVANEMREYNVSPSLMIYAADPDYALATYGITSYGSLSAVPTWRYRVYADGYGYDLYGKETDDRTFYYSDIPGVTARDTMYIDGAKKPTEMGFFVQDKIELDDIIINAGVRVDMLNPDEETLVSVDSIQQYDQSKYIKPDSWKDLGTFTEIQPRLGISFPLTDNTNVYGYYGRFTQLVDLNSTYYTAYDYRTQIAVGGNYYLSPVGFGLEPVRTTQYEIGFKRSFGDLAALKVTGFYKNQKGLAQADRVTDPKGELAGAYNYVTNGDFATTRGLEFDFTMRRMSGFQARANYTLSQAEGTGSSRAAYISAVDRGSAVPQMINPLDFNQNHVGSITLDYELASSNMLLDGLDVNFLFSFSSGHAYTFVFRPVGGQVSAYDAGVDYMYDTRSREALEAVNSSTTPWNYNLDLRIDKNFRFGNYGLTVFARVRNLLDARNILNVYQATGSADDDGFISDAVYSGSFVELWGQDSDGDGVTDYEEMYRAINIDNDESYRAYTGEDLVSSPRQAFLGIEVNF